MARGWADEFSDIEVFVFWDRAPTDQERLAAVERAGGAIDVFWSDREARERWRKAMVTTGGQVGQLWPHEDHEWSEHFFVEGIEVGVSGFLAATIDEWTSSLHRGVPGDEAEMVASTLLAGAPVTGSDRVTAWAHELVAYPRPLAITNIERWLEPDQTWWSIDQLAARNDRPAFDAVAVAMQRRLVRLWLALNSTYLIDPRPKWARRIIEGLSELPDGCAERLEIVHTAAPLEAAAALQELFDDTLDIIAREIPEVDTGNARRSFRHRRTTQQGTADGSPQ